MASLETQEEAMQTDTRHQEASASQTKDANVEDELTQEDLERTARDYAQYLVVNCQPEVNCWYKERGIFCIMYSCVLPSHAKG